MFIHMETNTVGVEEYTGPTEHVVTAQMDDALGFQEEFESMPTFAAPDLARIRTPALDSVEFYVRTANPEEAGREFQQALDACGVEAKVVKISPVE